MMFRNISPPKTGPISNILWLIFTLSFIWFPYLGMVSFPCNRRQSKSNPPSNSLISERQGTLNTSLGVPLSVDNISIENVFKDQRLRMKIFCAAQGLSNTVYRDSTIRDLYHHILVDDRRKLLFCYIPKVGCSNWKRVFLILAGIVDPGDRVRPSIEVFRQVNSLENYTPKEQEYRLRNYFKFMFIRHPPERVLSAYRNKIEHPLITNPEEQSIWDEVRYSILNSYRIKFNNKIIKEKKEELYPTFSEFIHFLYDSDPALMNEHYKPMIELCQPCAIDYDFVGNFATLRRDANAILDHLKINSSIFWDRGKHKSSPTVSYLQQYFKDLNPVDFKRLEERFDSDIAFYNYLFPYDYDGGYTQLKKNIWQL